MGERRRGEAVTFFLLAMANTFSGRLREGRRCEREKGDDDNDEEEEEMAEAIAEAAIFFLVGLLCKFDGFGILRWNYYSSKGMFISTSFF